MVVPPWCPVLMLHFGSGEFHGCLVGPAAPRATLVHWQATWGGSLPSLSPLKSGIENGVHFVGQVSAKGSGGVSCWAPRRRDGVSTGTRPFPQQQAGPAWPWAPPLHQHCPAGRQ